MMRSIVRNLTVIYSVSRINPKELELMRKLNSGLCVLNEMDVHDMHGRVVQFKV